MGKKIGYCLISLLALLSVACRMEALLSTSGQERAFRQRYVGKMFYTAMVLRPYRYNEEYLIDLSGKVAETDYQNMHAPLTVPLGRLIHIVDVHDRMSWRRSMAIRRVFGFCLLLSAARRMMLPKNWRFYWHPTRLYAPSVLKCARLSNGRT